MDEILVHISAATTRRNDDIYRSVTRAYHEFEASVPDPTVEHCANQRDLTIVNSSRPSVDRDAQKLPSQQYDSFVSKESYGSFPSFESSRYPDGTSMPSSGSRSFADSDPSSSRLAQLERIQREWKSRTDAKARNQDAQRSSGRSVNSSALDATFIEDSQLAAQAIHSQLSEFSNFSEGLSDGDIENALHSTLKPKYTEEERSSSPEETNEEETTTLLVPGTQSSNSVDQYDEDTLEDIVNDTLPYPLDFAKLPLEVYPPGPEVTTEAPTKLPSQKTSFLKATRRRKPDIFKPLKVMRQLRYDERGCWQFDTQRWPREAQFHFWTSLTQLLEKGKLGWGLSLYREPDDPSSRDRSLGQVRLYCWGEIVKEIWALLHTCSLGEISGSGSSWLDADELVVVEMP